MSKQNTKRKRQEQYRRSVSKIAAKLRKPSKAATLLAYNLRKKSEEASWIKYREDVQKERETHCATCPLSLMCMAAHCPDDVMICVNCACVFSDSARLIVKCDGFYEGMGLDRPWHSGQCPECYSDLKVRPHQRVVGFSVETPLVAATQRIQTHHYGGCSYACRKKP